MKNNEFIAYRLVIDDGFTIKRFLTKDAAEHKIKAMEVLDENLMVSITSNKFSTTSELFLKELQEIIS